VAVPPLVVTAGPASGQAVAASYSQANPASGGVAPYAYALAAGAFPPGTSLDQTTGTVSGTPTVAGTFSYQVQATDSQGVPVTAIGSIVTATIAKGAQTISFAPLPDASLSASPLTLSATASSGLTIAFASTTTSVCSVSGTTLTLLQMGSCSITASQTGDGNWDAASDVAQSFTVNPANLAISVLGASGTMVGANYSQSNPASGGVATY
jgi:hypothetical protein